MAEAKKDKEVKKRVPKAIKRDTQNSKKRLANRIFKSQVRTAIRNVDESLAKGKKAEAEEALSQVYSLMDKGVKLGIYKINKAARSKARLTARCASVA